MIARTWSARVWLALLLASCAAPAPVPSPVPSDASPMPRLLCRDSLGDSGPPPPDLEVFLDAAALPTQQVLNPNDSGDGWLFAKIGLYVRPDLTVELSIETEMDAGVIYGAGDRSRRVVLARCTQMPGRWIVYTGGYYVREPMCLPVRVGVNGNEALAKVPVGAACTKE